MDQLKHFGFLMKDVSRLSSKNFELHAVELNMTMAQCKVMGHLERNEGISQARLAELADTDPMTVVRILDRMERDGWVERRTDPTDRRARRLFLTQAAMPVLEKMWLIAERARAQALVGISMQEREQLMSLLTRIHTNLTAVVPAEDALQVPDTAKPLNALAMRFKSAAKKPRAESNNPLKKV